MGSLRSRDSPQDTPPLALGTEMTFLFNRAMRLFAYDDLSSSTVSLGRGLDSSDEVSINVDEYQLSSESTLSIWRRKRKRICAFSLVFGLVAVAIIALSVKHWQNVELVPDLPEDFSSATKVHRNGKKYFSNVDEEKLSLRSVMDGKFHAISRFNGTWINDEEFLFVSHRTGLMIANVNDPAKHRTVMSFTVFNHMDAYNYWLSADKKYLMLQVKAEWLFRRSSVSEYHIFPLEDGRAGKSMIKLRPTSWGKDGSYKLRLASFAPKGNGLVYVDKSNNIYYRKSVMSQDEKLTTTGVDNEIFNGIADWVFEEEVLEDTSALWWAPDGQKLVWGAFNDTDVNKILLKEYGPWNPLVDQYPFIDQIAYPKVGTKNPQVQLWLADLTNDQVATRQIFPPRSMSDEAEVHFSWVTFVDSNTFAVQWMNRVQNRTVVTLCHTSLLSDCIEIFAVEEPDGWINYKYRLVFDPTWRLGNDDTSYPRFITILSSPPTKEKYRQVLLVSNNTRTYLTMEKADVTKILRWTESGDIFYMSSPPMTPTSRHMYRLQVNKDDLKPECITCNRTDMAALHRRECAYHDVDMSSEGSYYAMVCQGPDVPYVCVHETASGKLLTVYEDNHAVTNRMKNVDLPTVRLMEVPVDGFEQKAQVKVYLPPHFDASQKYPTLVYAYGGPGSQQVTEKFDHSSFQTFMSGGYPSFVYVIIDPVGTGQQGDSWLFALHKAFGTVEVTSTIAVTKYLQEQVSFIDGNRTAIWGWSYGGFLSLSVLGQDEGDVFKCGASVAPVVDWTLYDTYYTERYMGLKDESKSAYNRSRVFWHLENLRRKPFFLLHGTMDDNVHYQQSMLLSAALESKNILFRQQAYPDQNHNIGRYQKHLYLSLTDFFVNECFSTGSET